MKIDGSPENNHIINTVLSNGNGDVTNGKCDVGRRRIDCGKGIGFELTENHTNGSDDSLNNNNHHSTTNGTVGEPVVTNGTDHEENNKDNHNLLATSNGEEPHDIQDVLSGKLKKQIISETHRNGHNIDGADSHIAGADHIDDKETKSATLTCNADSKHNENADNHKVNNISKFVDNSTKPVASEVNIEKQIISQSSAANASKVCDDVQINGDVAGSKESDEKSDKKALSSSDDAEEKDGNLIVAKNQLVSNDGCANIDTGNNVAASSATPETSKDGVNVRPESSTSSSSSTLTDTSAHVNQGTEESLINGTGENDEEANSNNNKTEATTTTTANGKNESDNQDGSSTASSNTQTAPEPIIIYQFELAQYLCGRLIGRNGHFVNQIKEKSNASVIVNRHPLSPHHKICSIEGTRSEIRRALRLIRARFPIYDFPEVTLQQINVISPLLACQVTVPQSCQLHLPEGVSCDVILSNVVNAGHIFVRQPTHPTYPSLSRLDQFMNATYSPIETPPVLNPHPGDICAVNMMSGWYRAMVVNVWDDNECEVKFVDYGGYSRAPISSLRQIRYDFMTLPFQATECYLANVKPIDESQGWSKEANVVFHDLAQGQMLQAKIVAYADDGIPLIHLHKIQGASTIFINQELVNRGLAQWVEHQMWE